MAAPNLVDMLNRTTSMGKKTWIKKAVPKARKGVFKEKAGDAGETTAEYAREKEHAPGALGKEARLAETLMGMGHKKHREKLYGKRG
jgi:hypothetical protein